MYWTLEELRALADDLCLHLSPKEEADLLRYVEKMAQTYQEWCPSGTAATNPRDVGPDSATLRETVWRADVVESSGLTDEFWAQVPEIKQRLVVVPRVVKPRD